MKEELRVLDREWCIVRRNPEREGGWLHLWQDIAIYLGQKHKAVKDMGKSLLLCSIENLECDFVTSFVESVTASLDQPHL